MNFQLSIVNIISLSDSNNQVSKNRSSENLKTKISKLINGKNYRVDKQNYKNNGKRIGPTDEGLRKAGFHFRRVLKKRVENHILKKMVNEGKSKKLKSKAKAAIKRIEARGS